MNAWVELKKSYLSHGLKQDYKPLANNIATLCSTHNIIYNLPQETRYNNRDTRKMNYL